MNNELSRRQLFVVTFPVGGPRADCYAELDAHDETSARRAVLDVYGNTGWAFLYDSLEAAGVERYQLERIEFGQ